MLKNIMNKMNKKKKKGFTLIELIIVIAIIAILAAIALPKFMTVRETANVKSDLSNAKNIQTVVATLVAEDKIPVSTTFTFDATNASGGAATAAPLLQSVEQAKSKEFKDAYFKVVVDGNGEVSISVTKGSNTEVVYPNATGTIYGKN